MEFKIQLPDNFNNLPNDIEEVKNQIRELHKKIQPKEPTTYITRNELAKKFKVDISTIHNWTVKGYFTAFQIGGRVYYKLKQVESAIIELKK